MSEKMLKFVTTKGQTPEKSSVDDRVKNFSEIYKNYIAPKAEEQSSRCSQCGVPYCQIHCPLSNNIPDWLKLTAEGRLEEAYEVSSATNNMPEVCGRICPQDRLCEGNCVIERAGHGTVTIGSIEKFITDTAFFSVPYIPPAKPKLKKSMPVPVKTKSNWVQHADGSWVRAPSGGRKTHHNRHNKKKKRTYKTRK